MGSFPGDRRLAVRARAGIVPAPSEPAEAVGTRSTPSATRPARPRPSPDPTTVGPPISVSLVLDRAFGYISNVIT